MSGQCSGTSEPKVKQRYACGELPETARPGSVEWRKPEPKTSALPRAYSYLHHAAQGVRARVDEMVEGRWEVGW